MYGALRVAYRVPAGCSRFRRLADAASTARERHRLRQDRRCPAQAHLLSVWQQGRRPRAVCLRLLPRGVSRDLRNARWGPPHFKGRGEERRYRHEIVLPQARPALLLQRPLGNRSEEDVRGAN